MEMTPKTSKGGLHLSEVSHNCQQVQDERLKSSSEAIVNMKVLKLYAWETHFKNVIENLRKIEHKWLSAVQSEKAYHSILHWSTPVLVSSATFGACFFLRVPLHANNVFTFVATFRLVQDPITSMYWRCSFKQRLHLRVFYNSLRHQSCRVLMSKPIATWKV